MRLRRRLVAWYGTVIALVVAAALWLAYDLHTAGHDSDVDTALADMVVRAREEIDLQLGSGIPLSALDLSSVHRAIDEPHAAWLLAGGRVAASSGAVADISLADTGLTELAQGWYTFTTPRGRVRADAERIGVGTIVVAADLSLIDTANAELRIMFSALWVAAVAVGAAIAAAVAGRALQPVATLIATARDIAETRDFERRVHIAGHPDDELVTLARTFDDMLVSLDDAYRQQQRFLGDVSHELRTPLTTIRGNAELLATGELSPADERQAIARIARESARVSRLVDELLVLARADAAEAFVPRPVDLDDVIMEAFDEMRVVGGDRLAVRAIDVAVVNGERDRLKQLALVLIDNALRYTPLPGRVSVALGIEDASAVLSVEDEGVGVDEAELPHVFERFYRGAAARRSDAGGSGLGLAIARWIVERHGGSIRLASRSGRGTIATARLPLAVRVAVAG